MGYYATYDGRIKLKETPPEEIDELIKDTFDVYDVENNTYYFGDNSKYYEDEVYHLFNEINSLTAEGEIDYQGEDSTFWRFIFNGTEWVEESGSIVYESEQTKIKTNSEKLEFLCDIIEKLEDFLEEKGIYWENDERNGDEGASLIYGTEYGNLESALEELMQKWHVLEKKEYV